MPLCTELTYYGDTRHGHSLTDVMAARIRLKRWIRAWIPAPVKRWLRERRRRPPPSEHPDALVQRYLAGGRIPWSPGYAEYRLQHVAGLLGDEALLQAFRDGRPLPAGHGYRLDERVVEYPWVFSRARDWGSRVLDAGSTLNDPALLAHPALQDKEIILYNLAHDRIELRKGVSYLTGDLRDLVLHDGVIDVVVCISTLEHVGLDNTLLYTAQRRYRENRPSDYRLALAEFRRVLRPGGRLLVTVPYGRPGNLGWLQQFDRRGVEEMTDEFAGRVLNVSYFKYEPAGWVRANAEACAACEYFDIHAKGTCDPDYAAAARGVACLELMKPA